MNLATWLIVMGCLVGMTFWLGRLSKQHEYEDELNEGLRSLARIHDSQALAPKQDSDA